MNDEKKIAQAILDAQKMREESYEVKPGMENMGALTESIGEYKLEIEECLIKTCEEQGLSENLWALLNLAMHWWNDIQLWAEDILADRNVLDQMRTLDEPCCDSPSKDHCEQCQEIGLADLKNQG